LWINPKIRAERPEAPRGSGRRLLSCPRGDEQLRLHITSCEGRPFVDARVWARGTDGSWFPTKRACSIRLHEVDAVIAALGRVRDVTPTPAENRSCDVTGLPPSDTGSHRESPQPPWMPGPRPTGATTTTFDEFEVP
jgi:hypothetical protein